MRFATSFLLASALLLTASASADAAKPKGSKQQQIKAMTAEEVFKQLDVNHNGKINFYEFQKFQGIPKGGKQGVIARPTDAKDLAATFKRLDVNDDKVLTLEEFQAIDQPAEKPKEKKKKK